MAYVLAVYAFPLLLVGVSVGVGLLIERIAGWSLPALLIAPLGFAGVVGVTQLTTWISPLAPATPWILLAAPLAGLGLSAHAVRARWQARRAGWWWGFAGGVAAYLIAIGPVLMAGRATFPGYLLDTTGSVQLMGAERLVTEGHHWSVPDSGYGAQLAGYFGNGYPSGAHSAFGGIGALIPVDYLWLYAPYLAAALALTALVLVWIALRSGLAPWAAAVSGCVAAVPALVYAYLLQGSIKEIVVLPFLMLLGARMLLARDLVAGGARSAVPLAVVAAAGWGVIGLAFTPWLGLAVVVVVGFGVPALAGDARRRIGAIAIRAAVAAPAAVLLALPTLGPLSRSLRQANAVTTADAAAVADPGNLLRPLLDTQLFGVWLGASHRVDPQHLRPTYVLIGVVIVAAALGVVWLVRRRNWPVLLWVVTSVLVWLLLTPRATTWSAAKLLVLLSPVILLVAFFGAFGRLGSRRLEGVALGAAVAFGVLASDALLYHYTGLAPTARFDELREIGIRYADSRRTLTPDFDEYALYLLRDMAPDGPGNARKVEPWTTVSGDGVAYGASYDVDALPGEMVDRFDTIVVRRSPLKSRPPSPFRLAWRGLYYDVWRRDPSAPAPLLREPLGAGPLAATRPTCRAIGTFVRRAREVGAAQLVVAPRRGTVATDLARVDGSPNVVVDEANASASFAGPGTLAVTLRVPRAGAYRLWAVGNTGRELRARVDGRPVGAVRAESGGQGNALQFGEVRLAAGRHRIELVRGGGTLRPGDADPTTLSVVALEPVADDAMPLRTLALADWRTLCGGRFDWLEAR